MPPPHQENLRVLALVFFVFWLATSSGDGNAGYFSAPFLTQERLARKRHAFTTLNSTSWGDFFPRLLTDPPNGTESTRYLNLTGFRKEDGFAWDDLGRFKDTCLERSRHTSPMLPISEGEEQGETRSAWDLGIGSAVWQNATGIVKGPWIRREGSVNRTWTDYNFTAMTPNVAWVGTHGEWDHNVTGSEGSMQLRLTEKRRHIEYDDEVVDLGQGLLNTGGIVREVSAGLRIEDDGPHGSGGAHDIKLHGVHWPRQGNMLLTTTSEKFAGIFGLPHLAPEGNYFRSSQRLLNESLDEALRKMERNALTDSNNPWASGAEDAWNPTPHCEYVVYLQVHPIRQQMLSTAKDADLSPGDGVLNLVKEIEDELRYPTGAPIPAIPQLQLSAVVYSPDCAYFLESKGPPHFSELSGNNHLVGFKEEVWIYDINFCMLAMAVVALGQVYLLKAQMRESYTPSTMGRVSFWTLIIMLFADGMIFAHAIVLALDTAHIYLQALILAFVMFMSMMIGGSFLGEIYKIQETEWRPRERENASNNNTPRPPATSAPPTAGTLPLPVTAPVSRPAADVPIIIPSDQDIGAEIAENLAAGAAAVPTPGTAGGGQQAHVMPFSTIVGRLLAVGSILAFLLLASTTWWKPIRTIFVNTILFMYLSFWIPQIIRNTKRNSRRAFSWPFMVGQSVLRIWPVAYFYVHPNNMILSDTDWMGFTLLAGWLWLQLWILFFQDVLGPRFGLPKGWMPEAWDYHPVLREDSLESGGLPIGLAPSASNPSSPILERVRSLSLGSSAAGETTTSREKSTAKDRTHMRAIDCAICCEVLEVPVVRAGADAEPAGGGVAGVLERRRYMVTPCRHIFHSACLEGWLRFRLQCPICREELPPL